MSEYGIKTWKEVSFEDLIPNRKRNRIIGLTFPRQDTNLGLEPSILTVLPDGDNVEYCMDNRDFNDDDVRFYFCSVYISGYDEFKQWSLRHDINKIIVGGYQPTTFPEDFKKYASKIIIGPCDDVWNTCDQMGQIVQGITSNKRIPRYDLYDIKYNQQIIPDKKPDDVVISINTSMGCPMKCDFCCSPIMCPTLVSKPISLVKEEVEYLTILNPKFLFIRDENFPLQKDWKERLEIIEKTGAKIYLFASANTLTEDSISFMKNHGVYMVCLGLEDITVSYGKNKNLDEACALLKKYGIYSYLSFIVNPLKIVGQGMGEEFYGKLMQRFEELKPEMVCGNFLMPFKGTKLWDEYYHLVSLDDYKSYDSKSAFLIKNPIIREKMEFFMFYYKYKYFTSDFYKENVREFETGDTLNLRFKELYEKFIPKYERLWNVRG